MFRKSLPFLLLGLAVAITSSWAGTGPEDQYTFLAGVLPDTLYLVDSPYMVLADVSVDPSTHIEAGVEVYFSPGTNLSLSSNASSFYCDGTEASPVSFLASNDNPWEGILIEASSTERTLVFSHTEIIGAWGSGCNGLEILISSSTGNTHIELDGLTVSNWSAGIYLNQVGSPQVIDLSMNGVVCTGSWTGFSIDSEIQEGLVSLQECEFIGNLVGLRVRSPATVNWCTLYDNTDFDVLVSTDVNSYPSLNFQYNNWGPTTTQEMIDEGLFSDIESIHDWWDESGLSIVDYSGFDGGPTGVQMGRFEPTTWSAIKKTFR